MSKTIAFLRNVYAQGPFIGAPENIQYIGGQTDRTMTGPQLLELYNLVSSNLGRGRVKRFADRAAAEKRTWAILEEYEREFTAAAGEPPARHPEKELKAVHDSASGKPNHFKVEGLKEAKGKVQLSDNEKRGIKEEAAARGPTNKELADQLMSTAAEGAAQAQLRASPPVIDPVKDAEMPALRKALKSLDLQPKNKVYPRKAGSKQAILVDLLARPQGATFGELYDGLAATGKPWKGVTIRSGLAWDTNHIAGYGVVSELLNGEAFAAQGREYEARRLGMTYTGGREGKWVPGEGYDPELKLAVYRLTYPKGMDAPIPHTPKKA